MSAIMGLILNPVIKNGSSVCLMQRTGLQGMKLLYRKTFGDLCQLFSI